MPRLVVLFGPPATGKSYSYKREIKKPKYKDCQIVNIDKDLLNKCFFCPPLIKTAENSPTDILWKTTSHLVDLISTEFAQALNQIGTADEKDLIVFLQGVTIGGVASDIANLLKAGYSMEFILITVEDPLILSKRISARALSDDAIGAPPMPAHILQNHFKSCNSTFYEIVKTLLSEETGSQIQQSESTLDDTSILRSVLLQYKSSITYRVELTRFITKGLDISKNTGIEFERNVTLDVFLFDEIHIKDNYIVLDKVQDKEEEEDSTTQYILAIG